MPRDLIRASVISDRRHRRVKLSNLGQATLIPPIAPPTSLYQSLERLPEDSRWAVKYMDIPDDGITLAEAIRSNQAIGVSDGSLKFSAGTAAFVFEGSSSFNRIRGVTDVPAPVSQGDSHRPELTGLFAMVIFINALCLYHRISDKGLTMTIACDNQHAIQVFDQGFLPDPRDKNFDLVHALWATVKESPISWQCRHVKGHQDRHSSTFTRMERLNIEMDSLAKTYWRHLYANPNGPTISPQFRPLHNEIWSIWAGETKIVSPHRRKLYELLQDPVTQSYWTRHHRFTRPRREDIDWDSVQSAMQRLPPARRKWITKQASENCGVGKTLLEWKFQTDDACPRCGSPEDTQHVLQCQGAGANENWMSNMCKLEASLTKLNTDPAIQTSLILCLNTWRNRSTLSTSLLPRQIVPVIRKQCQIGWKNFLHGLPVVDWRSLQHEYYQQHDIAGSSKKWAASLIVQLHHLAWGQWNHRNNAKYRVHKPREKLAMSILDRQITKELIAGVQDLPPGDRHHFRHNLMSLLRRNAPYKRAWFTNVTMARERQTRVNALNNEGVARSRETSLLLKYLKTGRCI